MKSYRVIAYSVSDPNAYDFQYTPTRTNAEELQLTLLKEGFTTVEIEEVHV